MLIKLTQGEIELVKWVFELNGVVIEERHFHHPSSEFVPEKLKKENKKGKEKKRKITFNKNSLPPQKMKIQHQKSNTI